MRPYILCVGAAQLGVLLLGPWAARAADPVLLQERFSVGNQYQVHMRTDLSGNLTPAPTKERPNPKPLEMKGDSAFEYAERVVSVDREGQVSRSVRYYQRMELKRTVADRPQESKLRPAVRRLVVLRDGTLKAPFSPDGPLLWSEIDLMRSDVFTPALVGLLPAKAVQVGEKWTASNSALQELTGMDRIEEGQVECKLEEVGSPGPGRRAQVTFEGTVRGITEDGPNRHQIKGYFLFDLTSNHINYLFLTGSHSLLDSSGKEMGRTQGRFVLQRQFQANCPEISDNGLRGVTLEPNAENTQLLYDNATLGVRFVYPRRWWPSGVRGRQLTLDSADGHGMLITLDPVKQVPTGEQFLAESRKWLQDQKARLVRVEPPRLVPGVPGLEHFALEAEMGGQKFLMDYHVLRQENGGATLAARLLPTEQESARREVERLARSLAITRKIEGK
jgi:hypothetical protein